MNVIIERIRARLRFIGAQLNAAQALIIAYIVMNPGAPREAINAIVPAAYRPIGAAIAGFVAWWVVNKASHSDAKKVLNGAAGDPR